jgi:hypothetical protein
VKRALLASIALAAFAAAACGYSDPYTTTGPVANESPGPAGATPGVDDFNAGQGLTPVKFPDGLQYIELREGTGLVAHGHDTVVVQYTGWFSTGGPPFDTSRTSGQPITVPLGQGKVIPGWDEGIPGMRAGGQRKLIIPSALAYGPSGSPADPNTGIQAIPPNSNLVFEIELVGVTPGPSPSPVPTPTPSPSPSPSPSK